MHSRDRLKQRLFQKQGEKCWICTEPMILIKGCQHPRSATFDHVIPLKHKGTWLITNLRLAHKLCNSVRSDGVMSLRLARILALVKDWPPEILYPPRVGPVATPAPCDIASLTPFSYAWLVAKGYLVPV